MGSIRIEQNGPVCTIVLSRPGRRNAIDRATADALVNAFAQFEADTNASVAVLYGEGGTFCAGADLHEVAAGRPNRVEPGEPGPLGPTRSVLSKPVIAAVEGHAVAGGLELALWCDLRVAARSAVFGVYCRRWGVPLIDGGTVRLPRIVGLGRALDLVLTGRSVAADEAHAMGLVNRVVADGDARSEAEGLAAVIASFPQVCVRSDRQSVYSALDMELAAALQSEHTYGLSALAAEGVIGAQRFAAGAGRGGSGA